MLHLAHPKDSVAVQVLGFIRALLYLGNQYSQKKIGFALLMFIILCANEIGHLISHRDTKFFIRINKLLQSVIVSKSQPSSK